ncbi:MAG: hypothetical protein NVS9B4_04510 [Candidatus Acidiferrum sp.]
MVVLSIGATILALRWPFSEKKVVAALQDDFSATVKFEKFHSTYFPRPGCVGEEGTLRPKAGRLAAGPDAPPLVVVKKFTVQANYFDLFFRPGHLARLTLDGLVVHLPALGEGSNSNVSAKSEPVSNSAPTKSEPGTGQRKTNSQSTTIGELIANDSRLEIARAAGREALGFDVHRLSLTSLATDVATNYDVTFSNPLPPGEIHARGKAGPWNGGDKKEIPVVGSYVFEKADLSVFHGIAGTLYSTGRFRGVLGRIRVQGTTESRDFQVVRSKHTVPLNTRFEAVVDGTSGDTILNEVVASVLGTVSRWDGRIAGKPGVKGKTAELNVSVRSGRIQDVLRMFVSEKSPPLSGITNFRAHITLPPGPKPFLHKVMLDGDFVIADVRFVKQETQAKVDQLSKRALGNKGEKETPNVTAEIAGHVRLRNASAHLSQASLEVPGAEAELGGVYELETEKVDLHGNLKTVADVSHNTTGLKSILLKPLNPLFKRKDAAAVIPVGMTGTYHEPHFGVEIPGKKKG